MASTRQRRWSRDELLKTLSLYYRLPFGKMHQRNPDVIGLSKLLDRTPSAVAMKLVNFASLDPDLKNRGVGGMQNTSALDREVWDEYYGKWELLSVVGESVPDETGTSNDPLSAPTERYAQAKLRQGQWYFRTVVLAVYEGACCLTGIETAGLLRASHIIPWAVDEKMRLEPRNGLCLNALHDAAFGRGLITFSAKFELVVSPMLAGTMPTSRFVDYFGALEGKPIRMPERLQPDGGALEYHRNKVFVG